MSTPHDATQPSAVSRRVFVKSAGAAMLGAAALGAAQPAAAGQFTGRIKKAVKWPMIKADGSVLDKFRLVQELGYDGVEMVRGADVDLDELCAARDATGLPVHGYVNGSVENISTAVDAAKKLGATSVLLVAGRVNENMPYAKNYEDTQATIAAAIPYAAEQEILLLVENVWNNFLLTPIEMARYLDELDSPWVGAYFDVGNVARFGWPEHWVPVLGHRIKKLDIKAYSRTKQMNEGPWKGFEVEIGDDEIDWAGVRRELDAIGFTGWATAEVGGGDRERLADIAARMDRVLDL